MKRLRLNVIEVGNKAILKGEIYQLLVAQGGYILHLGNM